MPFAFLDSHLHADMLERTHPGSTELYHRCHCGCITWSYLDHQPPTWEEYDGFWEALGLFCRRLSRKNAPFYYLAGLHPRSLPLDAKNWKRLPTELSECLRQQMLKSACLGLGELGVDTDDPTEERVFRLQLEWGCEYLPQDKRVGVHTPRKNKEVLTRRILTILADYPELTKRVVVDHATPTTLPRIRETGFAAGMTLQEDKATVEDVLGLIRTDPELVRPVMLNSDSGSSVSAPYRELLKDPGQLPMEMRQGLLRDNAQKFFGL